LAPKPTITSAKRRRVASSMPRDSTRVPPGATCR
jgi:hypothetical protein